MKIPDSEETRAYIVSHTNDECSEYFRVNVQTLRNFCKLHGLKCKRKKNKCQFDSHKFIEYARTHNAMEIANEFSIKKTSVYQRCRKLGIKCKKPITDAELLRNEMVVYLRERYTLEQIGMVFNVSRQRVHQIYEKQKGKSAE